MYTLYRTPHITYSALLKKFYSETNPDVVETKALVIHFYTVKKNIYRIGMSSTLFPLKWNKKKKKKKKLFPNYQNIKI